MVGNDFKEQRFHRGHRYRNEKRRRLHLALRTILNSRLVHSSPHLPVDDLFLTAAFFPSTIRTFSGFSQNDRNCGEIGVPYHSALIHCNISEHSNIIVVIVRPKRTFLRFEVDALSTKARLPVPFQAHWSLITNGRSTGRIDETSRTFICKEESCTVTSRRFYQVSLLEGRCVKLIGFDRGQKASVKHWIAKMMNLGGSTGESIVLNVSSPINTLQGYYADIQLRCV